MVETIDFVVGAVLVGERLDRAVCRAARADGISMSNGQAKALVEAGSVRLNGSVVRRASHRVAAADKVQAQVGELSVTAVTKLIDITSCVIYRDDVMLAIAKPTGLPTHQTHDPARDHAQAAVQRYLGAEAYIGVHHRLDVETSGVLVFATDRAANKGLADAFSRRLALKTYLALVARPDLPDSVHVKNHLARDRHNSRQMCIVHSGGDAASTMFEVLARSPDGALVQACPRTGRTHQIRVHLASLAAPIVGDVLYGGVPARRMMLHARALSLPHPMTGQRLELEAPAPQDFATIVRDYGMEVE